MARKRYHITIIQTIRFDRGQVGAWRGILSNVAKVMAGVCAKEIAEWVLFALERMMGTG